MCVSTSLMPTPGPPLREREGMMRRGRVVGPPDFEVEAVEGPACACEVELEEGPPAVAAVAAAEPASDDDAVEVAATMADAATATTAAGSAVDADARLGMRPGQRGGKIVRWVREEEGRRMDGLGVVAAARGSALARLWPLLCVWPCRTR